MSTDRGIHFLALLEDLAAEIGEEAVTDACRRYLADPQRGFTAALRSALDTLDKP